MKTTIKLTMVALVVAAVSAPIVAQARPSGAPNGVNVTAWQFAQEIRSMVQRPASRVDDFNALCVIAQEYFDLQEFWKGMGAMSTGSWRLDIGYAVSVILFRANYYQNLRAAASALQYRQLSDTAGPGGTRKITYSLRQGVEHNIVLYVKGNKIANIGTDSQSGTITGSGMRDPLLNGSGSTPLDRVTNLIVGYVGSGGREGCRNFTN